MPYTTSKRHFEELAGEALRGIPANYHKFFKNIVVIVEDFPDGTLAKEMGIPRNSLLGLFRGQSQGDKDAFFTIPSPYPDTIYLYQKNIEAACESEKELKEEIRMTILHEVGHYFGLSEDDLEKLENPG